MEKDDKVMKILKDEEYGGERPLYGLRDARLERVTIHVGESSIKESAHIEAVDCTFEGKYVFWECRGFKVVDSLFRESARSSLWYSSDVEMTGCLVEAPKMFRRMKGIHLTDCRFPNALETLWDCEDVSIRNCTIQQADYLGMHTHHVRIADYRQDGNYSFQYSHDVVIERSVLNSKDAFWESKDVTLIDCEINGEYFAWYSKNLRLVRCHITGEQPLCYCENLYMEDCTMGDDANLAFEYSSIQATLRGHVHSIKNPASGSIVVDSVGELIIEDNPKMESRCEIKVLNGEAEK